MGEGRPGLWRAMLLLGPTGAGKTPLGRMIEARGFEGRRAFHFDFGSELREISSPDGPGKSFTDAELETIGRSLETGALLEEKDLPLATKILGKFIERREMTPHDLLVLNGFPRHVAQARGLTGIVSVRRLIFLEASAEVIRERILRNTGGDRGGRADDSLPAIRVRTRIFGERTLPLVGYFQNLGVPVDRIEVGASMTAGDMFALLVAQESV